jgi:signal transduction histidine kinase
VTISSAVELRAGRRADEALLVAAGVTGAVLTGFAVAIVLSSEQPGDRYLVALASALVVGVPVWVGIATWRMGEYVRFGRLLVGWGLISFLPILAYSSDPTAYSIGRIGIWIVEPVAIGIVLSFPSGRLRTTFERGIVVAASATVALLFVPTAFLVEKYPEPSLWSVCEGSCPGNEFMLAGAEPAFVDAWVLPLREFILIAVYVAVAVALYQRLRASTALGRRMLSPVLAIAIGRSLAMAGGLALRRSASGIVAVDLLAWLFVLGLPALALAFAVGLVRARLFTSSALQRLATRLPYQRDAEGLRDCLASTLDDPSLEVAYWMHDSPGRWVDARGKGMRLPGTGADRSVTEIQAGGQRVAAFIHDPALAQQQPFVEAAGTFALTALENHRLRAHVDVSLESLLESRARIQAAADSERIRIERDLHDGAQQRLVALRVRLELAADAVREDPALGPGLLHELGEEVEVTLDEVRSLARGIYPSLLADRGLDDALRDASRRVPVTTTVETVGVGRYSAEIEAAVYFCCLEALQNVAKHAREAKTVFVSVVDDGALGFEVCDDGQGFDVDAVGAGAGLTNMRDRTGAVGGELRVRSSPGAGTTVSGIVPLP